MTFSLPAAQLTEVPPQGAILPIAPADIPVFLFCSSKGTNFQVVQQGAQQQREVEILFGAGTRREGDYIASKVPTNTVWVKLPATAVNGQASAVDQSGVTGTAVIGAIAGTILDGYDVVVEITTGGTIGTSWAYKASFDGGATFPASPTSVTTATSITLTGTYNGVSIATGITVALTGTQTFVTNDVFKFFTLPPSQSILSQTKTITRVNASTSTLTPSGTPNDAYEVLVTFGSTTGTTGTIGIAGLTYQVSLDGGLTLGLETALPLSGVITIPDHTDAGGTTHQTGLTLTCGVGTLDPGDQILFKTTAPVAAVADIQTAMDAVRSATGVAWSFFYVCGWGPVATRNTLDTKMGSYATSGRFTWTAVSGRDLISGERVASSSGNAAGDIAWANRIVGTGLDGWGSSVGNRTFCSFGSVRVTDPNTGRRNRRPFACQEMSQILSFTPDTNPGQYSNGPLSADTSITDQNGLQAEHDARVNPTIYAIGGNVIRTWEGEQGIIPGLWCADGLLMSSSGDITYIMQRRILNLADAALVGAMRNDILQKFGVAPSTARTPLVPGQIFPWDLKRITQDLNRQVRAAVQAYVANGAGGIFITVNPTPDPVTGYLIVTMQLNGKQYIRGFRAQAGFANPELFGIITPAPEDIMATWSLNTSRLSLSSLKLSVNGITIIGNTVSSIKETVTGEFMFGNGPIAIGIVQGTLSGECTLGFIPEEHDKILQSATFWAEYPMALSATLFEPASGSLYTIENDTIWMRDCDFDIAREGAVIKSMFKTQNATQWNGATALDLVSRATDPTSLGALFAGVGLSF